MSARRAALPRRALLAGIAGAASLAAAPAVAADPDAALLAACERFDALSRQLAQSFHPTLRFDDPEELRRLDLRASLLDRQDDLLSDMYDMRATTLRGHRARARVLLTWHGGIGSDGELASEFDTDRIWPLFRDLVQADEG